MPIHMKTADEGQWGSDESHESDLGRKGEEKGNESEKKPTMTNQECC